MKYIQILIFAYTLILGSACHESAHGQGAEDEVFLQFRHAGVVNAYISTIYHDDIFYVSVAELFSSLQIDHTIESGNNLIQGMYPGSRPFTIQFQEQYARVDSRRFNFSANDFVLTEFGFYLSIELFYQFFEMELTVDFSNLSLGLRAPDTMPVVDQRRREVQRDRVLRRQTEIRQDYYPLRDGRESSFFNAGFVDYNVSTNINRNQQVLNYSSNIGVEFLGGDIQGTILGSYSETASAFRSTGLRWRYGFVNNSMVSLLNIGQNRSSGATAVAYTGVRLTNEPIEPRLLYGESALTGSAFPNGDVELYRNNVLIDYARADESGFYSFNIPLTYGSSDYSVRSFSPGGLQSQRDLRFRIPNQFVPPGKFDYTVDFGRLDNPVAGSIDRGYMGQASFHTGLTNRITFRGGAEYFQDFHDDLPTFTGQLSTRLLTNHIVSIEAANDAYYRGSIQSLFANNASFNLDYTHFLRSGGIYNRGLNNSLLRMNLFTPFEIGNFPLYFRWAVDMEEREASRLYRYRVDLNTRLGRANLRIGFRDIQTNQFELTTTNSARVTASTTYTFRTQRNRESFFNGLFVRAQVDYLPAFQEIENAEVQISRRIRTSGRFQLSAGRNFISNFNQVRFSFSLDFSSLRSNTIIRSTRSNMNYSQSFRGTVGYDSENKNMIFSNRSQVGRAGAAVRLFVDNNNNGIFDEGDTIIEDRAVRVLRSSGRVEVKNGINYVTQLQSYRQYNLEVNKGAISNPLLVPAVERFSFIADPNQFKTIDIPFYTSGIIDGMVYRARDGERNGLGGIRLYLVQTNTIEGIQPHREELRTFSDGSFYAFEIPPGDYELRVDQSQKDFLEVKTDPEVLELTVRALSEGDFVEGLEINLIPRDPLEIIAEPKEGTDDMSELIPETIDVQDEDFAEQESDRVVEDIADIAAEEVIKEAIGELRETEEESVPDEYTLEIESLEDSLIMDPNQERTVSDIEIFTQDASCRFSIQMAEYRSLEEAFSGANRFERETGLSFQIYSAGPQSPFTIRTPERSYFGEVLASFNELLSQNLAQKPAIITQCADNEESGALRYLIQLAAFSNEQNAENFRQELMDKYRISSVLDYSNDTLVRVQAGPYTNRRDLLDAFRVLVQDNVSPGMFILVDPDSYYNISNEFRLQVGVFSDPRDAVRYAFEISEAFNIDTFVIVNGSAVKVMVNKNYEAWDDAFRDFTLISSYENANQPAIHLSEQD